VEQASERRIIAESVPLPDIPMASEESVHMLTAVRFPPPALFFANPDKKWSLGDFEKTDRVTTYSVNDDATETQDEQDAYLQKDQVTTTKRETEAEAEVTTIIAPVDESIDGLQQPTVDGHAESLQPVGDGHAGSLQPIGDGHAENLQPTHDLLADSRPTIASRVVVMPKQQKPLPPVRVVNQQPTDRWSEKRWTASRDRPRRPTPSDHGRPPIRRIVLTSRPLPVPGTDVRFLDVEYAVARLGERKNMHDFRRQ